MNILNIVDICTISFALLFVLCFYLDSKSKGHCDTYAGPQLLLRATTHHGLQHRAVDAICG